MDIPIPKEEVEHVKSIISEAITAIKQEDTLTLKNLSNQTIHSSATFQDIGSILFAIVIYSTGKIIERKEQLGIKNWEEFKNNLTTALENAHIELSKNNYPAYLKNLKEARKDLTQVSPSLKESIQDILRKASINKASKLYEHGLSIGQAAYLLGITSWELAEYAGHDKAEPYHHSHGFTIKERAQRALKFLS